MSIDAGDVPPGRTPPWRVSRVGPRAMWTPGTADCAVCDATVELDSRHYCARLERRDRGPVGEAEEELVFCTRTCLETWAREA